MDKKFDVVIVEPNKAPFKKTIDGGLKSYQSIVGGYIEVLHLTDDVCIVCNEEGKLIGLEPNRYIFNGADLICGNFVLIGDAHYGDFRSLTDDEIKYCLDAFADIPIKINPADLEPRFEFFSW